MHVFIASPRWVASAAGAAAFAYFVAGAPTPARAIPGLYDTIYTAGSFNFAASTFPNRVSTSASIMGGRNDVDFWSFAVVGAGRVKLELPGNSSFSLTPLLSLVNTSNETVAEVTGRALPFLNLGVGTYFARVASALSSGGGSYNLTVSGHEPFTFESGALLAQATPLVSPSAIPEPGTLALLGGLAGVGTLVGGVRRRR